VGQLTGSADWFKLRVPYDCSSYVHYYQLQGSFWKESIEKQVDVYMSQQGCESSQRGKYVNSCLVEGGHISGSRVIKEGYEKCLDNWETKHKGCVDRVIRRFPTFRLVDPNGKCKANGINKVKRNSWELSQYDIWALNAAYDGPLPPCQKPDKVGDGKCDRGNNNLGCGYDGGDCCLPNSKDKDCIDPCGVRLKFFGGRNRPCRKAPVTEEFCVDHYWYGPNKCSQEYCRQTDEKYLQWQCKKSCSLCNSDPDQKEMDKICNTFLGPEVRAKYNKDSIKKKKPKKKNKGKKFQKANLKKSIKIENTRLTQLIEETRSNKSPSLRTEPCGVNNSLICLKSTPAVSTSRVTSPHTTPRSKPRSNKLKSQPAARNRVDSKNNKKEKSRSSEGFIIASADKRKKLRSYWMRRG